MIQRTKNYKQTKISILLLILGLIFLISINSASASSTSAASSGADTIYVNVTGNDTWDGQSATWNGTSGPKQTIKNATDTVNNGGTVNIAEGTYSGSGNSNININKDMTINGAGIDKTIISGLNLARIFYIAPGCNVKINNLTFTNGRSDNGGAIFNNGNLQVNYCKFTNCTTVYKLRNGGSAITSGDYSTLIVKNSIFQDNDASLSSSAGGTILTNGTITLENCDFINNIASSGGAVFIFSGDLTATNCRFINNRAIKSGGVISIYTDYSLNNIHNCAFINNKATSVSSTNNIDNRLWQYLNITDNWWGSNSGPTGIDGLISDGSSWIYMNSTVDTPTTDYGGQINVQTDFNNIYHQNTGTVTHENVGYILDGFWVDFSSDLGTLNPNQALISGGIAKSVFTANKIGTGNITSSFNSQTLYNAITVNKAATTITTNNITGINDQTITLTATLTDNNGKPVVGRTVTFSVNGTSVGTATTDANGVATLSYKLTKAGNFTVNATFAGDNEYLTSSTIGTLNVTPASNLYMDTTTSNNNPELGQEFVITYKLGNYGPDAAENVTITFTLPEGLQYVDINVDSGTCSYDPATRPVTWNLSSVPKGDPYLYLTVRGTNTGTFTITPSITTTTYNWNTGGHGIISITINPASTSGGSSAATVNAASQTVGMQNTGGNPIEFVLAILAILGGVLLPLKK